jgi:hypothetical protein
MTQEGAVTGSDGGIIFPNSGKNSNAAGVVAYDDGILSYNARIMNPYRPVRDFTGIIAASNS